MKKVVSPVRRQFFLLPARFRLEHHCHNKNTILKALTFQSFSNVDLSNCIVIVANLERKFTMPLPGAYADYNAEMPMSMLLLLIPMLMLIQMPKLNRHQHLYRHCRCWSRCSFVNNWRVAASRNPTEATGLLAADHGGIRWINFVWKQDKW